jgi:hypothetical protein
LKDWQMAEMRYIKPPSLMRITKYMWLRMFYLFLNIFILIYISIIFQNVQAGSGTHPATNVYQGSVPGAAAA